MKLFLEKLKESCLSVLPMVGVISILGFFVAKIDTMTMVKLYICAIMVILGLTIFSLGVDRSMIRIGEYIGAATGKSKSLTFFIAISILVGVLFIVAEPDLKVLANQFPGLSSPMVLILIIAVGVGIFLAVASLRILFNIKMKYILVVSYSAIIILSFFVPPAFAPVAFDSSGIATGSLAVPILMAFGMGISTVRSTNAQDNSFGLVTVATIGPILSIMIFSLFAGNISDTTTATVIEHISFAEIFPHIGHEILLNLQDVAYVLIPIFVIFFAFHFFKLRLPFKEIGKIVVGVFYAYIGMVFFLAGINAGFLPIGGQLGLLIANTNYNWILIPLGLVLGLVNVLAEPAVHVLVKQSYEVTGGSIKKSVMFICMCIATSLSVCLAVVRCFLQINILWIIIPMIIICVALSFFVPQIFCGIGYDAGSVCSGPMAVAFILPMISGICEAFGISSMLYSFGTVAIIGTMPTIVVELLGLIVNIATKRKQTANVRKIKKNIKVIDFDYGE